MQGVPTSVCLLIDGRGEAWPDRSWELARRLGYRHPTLDLASYAVQKRGFIHLRPQDGGVRVALRAGRVKLAAIFGALNIVKQMRPERIMLAFLSEGRWFYEIITSLHEFAERAEHLAAGGPIEVRHPWLAVERDLGALSSPSFAQVRPIMRLWEASRGRLPEDLFRTVDSAELTDRMIVVRRHANSSRLIRDHVGAGIRVTEEDDTSSMIGTDIGDLPDRDYGAAMAKIYYESHGGSRPRLESVNATVRISPTAAVQGRYDRLVMPWRGSGSEPLVMCLSIRRKLSFVA